MLSAKPRGNGEAGDSRIVRRDGIHPLADRQRLCVKPVRVGRRQAGLHDEIAARRRFHQRLAVLGRKPHQLRHVLAQELAAGVEPLAQFVDSGFDAAADPVARLQNNEVDTLPGKLGRRGEAGEAGPDDDHLMIAAYSAQ